MVRISCASRKTRWGAALCAAALLLSGTAVLGALPQKAALAATVSPVYLVSDSPYAGSLYLVTYNRTVADGYKVQLDGADMAENRAGAWVALLTAEQLDSLSAASFAQVESTESSSGISLLGDINGNNAVNIVDAQLAYDLATDVYEDTGSFTEEQLLAADANADRTLDASDALAIQSYVIRGAWGDVSAFEPGADSSDTDGESLAQALAAVDEALAQADATDTTTSITDLGNNVYLVSFGDAPSTKVSTDEYTISKKNKVTLTAGGIYYFTNKTSSAVSGRVEVEVTDSAASTTLIMGGLNLTSDSEDGVFTITKDNAAETELVLREDTTSYLADTAEVTTDETDGTITAPDGALVIKKTNDLTISGTGTLVCSSVNGTGVKCNSDLDETTGEVLGGNLTIEDATIQVTSAGNNGISAEAGLVLKNCTIDASNVDGDGIKTSTPDDETDTTLGNIVANGATLTVSCYEDGIQAYRDATFTNCTVNVVTSDDSSHATTVEGDAKDSWKGVKSDGNMTITGGSWTINAADKAIKSGTSTTTDTSTEASTSLVIDGGTFNLTSTDDTVHSNGDITISAATSALSMTLSAGDDAVHADYVLTVDSGTIQVDECYEGLEGADIVINDGIITIVSSDDGLNVAGGNSASTQPGGDSFRPGPGSRPGQQEQTTTSSSDYSLTINGGLITVIPGGDGLDSNGDLYINGGTIYVNGPTTGGNGCLDYGDSDASFKISGGTLVAMGSGDMTVYPTTAGQAYAAFTLNSTYASGSTVQIKTSEGSSADAVISYTTECAFKYVMASSEDLSSGTTYYLYVNGNYVGSATATTSSSSGSSGGGMR